MMTFYWRRCARNVRSPSKSYHVDQLRAWISTWRGFQEFSAIDFWDTEAAPASVWSLSAFQMAAASAVEPRTPALRRQL